MLSSRAPLVLGVPSRTDLTLMANVDLLCSSIVAVIVNTSTSLISNSEKAWRKGVACKHTAHKGTETKG